MVDYSISKSTPIGKRFGMLTVIGHPSKRDGSSRIYVQCVCDCGENTVKASADLASGQTKSCGCFARKSSSLRERTHGMTTSREYNVWKGIKQRCTNPKHTHYQSYGGRGITMCERWMHSFENFLCDMGKRPDGMSLDRRDNSLGYSKENCHWVNQTSQARNTRSNNLITYAGRNGPVISFMDLSCVDYATLLWRINKGWSPHDALSTPSRNTKNRVNRRLGK